MTSPDDSVSALRTTIERKKHNTQLGAFSISLAVKDLEASRSFYEKCGFRGFAGAASQNWLILKNDDHTIGLFQGMFEKNVLTFNPGWDSNAQRLATLTDVRELKRQLKAQGVQLLQEADESTSGPASFIALDPDGNSIKKNPTKAMRTTCPSTRRSSSCSLTASGCGFGARRSCMGAPCSARQSRSSTRCSGGSWFYLPPLTNALLYQVATFSVAPFVAGQLVFTYRGSTPARWALLAYFAVLVSLELGWFVISPTVPWLEAARWFRGLSLT